MIINREQRDRAIRALAPEVLGKQEEPVPEKKRINQLTLNELYRLRWWAVKVSKIFTEREIPYQVGSSLYDPNYRDVDVRLILDSNTYEHLRQVFSLKWLDRAFSAWGEAETGLPIDFQIQEQDAANREFSGRRDALFIANEE